MEDGDWNAHWRWCTATERYEQDCVKRLVNAFMEENNVPEQLPITLGDMITERCIVVTTEQLRNLRQSIYEYLGAQGFDIRPLRPLHIDLRGNSPGELDESIFTRN